ncbi:MAG: SGNH/GDSL hydrolase family protein [Neisseria sp.]|nr:SGNH/GDSL hydrolase family protein [Neisseria sp.]
MYKPKTFILAAACAAALSACSTPAAAVPLADFQNGKAAWQEKLGRLKNGSNSKFRIVQIGDSHTAGDYFTQELRARLQAEFGNGGIGWVPPAAVPGQRTAEVSQKGSGWQVLSSRKNSGDFPLGGMMMRSSGFASMNIAPRSEAAGEQDITFTLRPVLASQPLMLNDGGVLKPIGAGSSFGWQHQTVRGKLPFAFESSEGDVWEVGPIGIENTQSGVTVSALGINGSQLSHWSKWRNSWAQDLQAMKADLVVLAYGTNEAFNKTIDIDETRAVWQQTVRQIRAALPEAGILIVGAPESLTGKSGECGQRPAKLSAIQTMQRQIAQQEKTLFWSWQDAMGGECSMKNWMAQGLGAKDGVHFSATGYRQAGGKLADALIEFTGGSSRLAW